MTSASPRPRVLLVDGDLQARLVFEVTLKASGYDVLVAAQGEEALSVLTRETVDVVVADTELAELDGFQLCSSVRARPEAARLLIVLLSSDRTQRNRARLAGSGADDFLFKPAYAHELDQRLRALLRRRQRERLIAGQDDGQPLGGALSEVAVVDLLSLIELSGRSGVLTVRGLSGSRGELYFRQGRVVDAEVGHLSGPEGVYRLLGWSTGSFLLEWKNIRRRDAVAMSNADILGEGLRRLDEWNRLLLGLPGTNAIYEVDYRKLADHLAEIPDEVNALLRLFDGVRSLDQVIEDSGFPDLDALRVIRRLVESRILVESTPSEAARTSTNPVFEGWQPEVSTPLAEVPIVPPDPEGEGADARLAGLPAPETVAPSTATSPGLGPREPAAEAAKVSGRSTALGIPTLERPIPPAATAPVPPTPPEEDLGEPAPEDAVPGREASAPGLSLDVPEEPEASLPVATDAATAEEPADAPATEEERDAIPRRQQTQIFSRKEAMDELGLSGRKSRWAFAFLAAAVAVAAGVSYGVWQSRGRESVPGVVPKEAVVSGEEPAPSEPPKSTRVEPGRAASSAPGSQQTGQAPSLPSVELPAGEKAPRADGVAASSKEMVQKAQPSQATSKEADAPAPEKAASREPPTTSPEGRGTAVEASRGTPTAPGAPAPARARAGNGAAETPRPNGENLAVGSGSAGPAAADFKGDPVKVLADCKGAFAAGRFRQALSACTDATKGNPGSAVAYAMLAHAQLNRDKPNEALAAAEKAIALDPSQADAYVIVGGVEQDRGHTAAAKAAYLKYLQLAPRGRYAADLRAIVDTL